MIGTMIVLMVGAAVLVPHQLPRAARIFGRFTGRSVRFLFQTKEALSKSSDSEMVKMKNDLNELMSEFYSVRSDIRQGFNIRRVNPAATIGHEMPTTATTEVHPNTFTSASATAATTTVVTPPYFTTNTATTTSTAVVEMTATDFTTTSINDTATTQAHNNSEQHHPPSLNQVSQSSNFAMAFASMHSSNTSAQQSYHQPQQPSFNQTTIPKQQQQQQQQVDISSTIEDMKRFKNVPIDVKQAPFSAINYSTQAMRGLQEEGSMHIRTEGMGGGADLIAKSILERNFAEYSKEQGVSEGEILAKWITDKKKKN